MKRLVLYAAAGVLGLACLLGFAIIRTEKAVKEAEKAVLSANSLAFTRTRLQPNAPSGMEYLAAPAGYRDATVWNGRLYIGGAQALIAVDEIGHVTDSWRTGELLPARITALAATTEALWIATDGAGLIRFDGRAFEQVLPVEQRLQKLTAILPLTTGNILLGTAERGVMTYDGQKISPTHSMLGGGRINALAGNDSDLWIGTADRGLLHLRAGQVESFTERDSLPDGNVLSVAASSDRAWAGTALGVAEFQAGKFRRVLGEGVFARSLAVEGNQLLVGTLENGLYRLALDSQRSLLYPATNTGAVEKIVRWSGKDWVLRSDNLYEARSATPLLAPAQAVLTDGNISALSVDERGRLWTGYFDRGLDVIDLRTKQVTHREDEHLFCVNRIVHDTAKSQTAVATANGLVMLNANAEVRQVIGRAEGLIANHVTDVALTGSGLLAATPAGLTWLDGSGPRSLYAFHGLINNHVYSVGVAQDRALAGTLGGLSLLEAGAVKANYSNANSPLSQNWITAVAPDGRDFYVGTYGAGVFRLNSQGHWDSFPEMPAIEINPNALVVSSDRVYAGSLGRGLLFQSRVTGRWSSYTRGLPSLNVTAVAVGNGYVYIGTDNGLLRIPESSL